MAASTLKTLQTIATWNTGKIQLNSLVPDTQYHYQLEIDNTLSDWASGTFTTPSVEPFSYKVAFGSCLVTGSTSTIFRQIAHENPLLFINTGDLHYENINSACTKRFVEAYYRTFGSVAQQVLYHSTAFAYVWDDHDYGNNNSDGSAPCREEAIDAYRQFIPHYPLAFAASHDPVSQAFAIGRVRFLLTDLRSRKVKPEYDDCQRTVVGSNFGSEEHLRWFFNQLLTAKNAGQAVVWLSGIPFINHPGGPNYECDEDDDWGGFPEERRAIADFVKQHQIPISIISGDAHMVAIDNGSNSDYATGGGAPIPVFHAAPLDRYGSYKGGPYSHGYRAENGQYGIMEVEDAGGSELCIVWTAKNQQGEVVTNEQGQQLVLRFCHALPANP